MGAGLYTSVVSRPGGRRGKSPSGLPVSPSKGDKAVVAVQARAFERSPKRERRGRLSCRASRTLYWAVRLLQLDRLELAALVDRRTPDLV